MPKKPSTKPASEKRSRESEQLHVARRLAASAEKQSVIADWLARREAMRAARGGELVVPDVTADVAEIQARLRVRALAVCEDILLHSINEGNQLRAAEIALGIDHSIAAEVPKPLDATPPQLQLTDDQASKVRDLLAERRRLQRENAR